MLKLKPTVLVVAGQDIHDSEDWVTEEDSGDPPPEFPAAGGIEPKSAAEGGVEPDSSAQDGEQTLVSSSLVRDTSRIPHYSFIYTGDSSY